MFWSKATAKVIFASSSSTFADFPLNFHSKKSFVARLGYIYVQLVMDVTKTILVNTRIKSRTTGKYIYILASTALISLKTVDMSDSLSICQP